MDIRKLVFGGLGIGLAGLVNGTNVASAEEPISYVVSQSTPSNMRVLTDKNWDVQIGYYPGASIVLFYNSGLKTEKGQALNANMVDIMENLAEEFEDERVNGYPIKFGLFDEKQWLDQNLTRSQALSHADRYGLNDFGIYTIMYKDSNEIDRRTGGPLTKSEIDGTINNMKDGWIPSNLLGALNGSVYRYEGDRLHQLPR